MAQGSFDRSDGLSRLASTYFDVVVVGAGLSAAGAAVDAAARGLRTALICPDDWDGGRSGPTLLRPDLPPITQAARAKGRAAAAVGRLTDEVEATRLRTNVPFLIRDLPLDRATPEPGRSAAGRLAALAAALAVHRSPAALRSERSAELASVVNERRLALTLARTAAVDLGVAVASRVRPLRLAPPTADARGERPFVLDVSIDEAADRQLRIATRWVLATAGEASRLLSASEVTAFGRRATPATATVLVVAPGDVAGDVLTERRLGGGGGLLVMPWSERTLVVAWPPNATPPPSPDAVLATLNAWRGTSLDAADICASWPLELAPPPSPAVTVVGPHLAALGETTALAYRRAALTAIDTVVDRLDDRAQLRVQRRSATARLALRGAVGWADIVPDDRLARRWPAELLTHLVGRYGGDARVVLALAERRPDLARPVIDGLPDLRAEAVYAARYEMAATVADVVERRLELTLRAPAAAPRAAADLAGLLADVLGWDADRHRAEATAGPPNAERSAAQQTSAAPTAGPVHRSLPR